jgi:hypothetical protein
LLVYCEGVARKREVDKAIISGLQRLSCSDFASRNHSVFAAACENISEADSIYGWVKKINGDGKMSPEGVQLMKLFAVLP